MVSADTTERRWGKGLQKQPAGGGVKKKYVEEEQGKEARRLYSHSNGEARYFWPVPKSSSWVE